MNKKKKKRPFGFFDNFFGSDFEDEMDRMQQEIEEVFSRMREGMNEEDFEKFIKPGRSKVYGFSFRMGPDGKPVFEEFGNVKAVKKPMDSKQIMSGDERQPLVDVLKGKEEVTVIAEVPGADKKNIKLSGDEHSLIIDVKGKRRYYKKLYLPARVDHSKKKWTYKNGILEVKLKKK